jgi:ribose 5-phosphate isomerase B
MKQSTKQTIIIAADHGGWELKQELKTHLSGYDVTDVGAMKNDPEDDFPPIINRAIEAMKKSPNSRGIFICGSGVGACIAANRHKGIRAAVIPTSALASLARQHNDLNVICLAGRTKTAKESLEIIQTFLTTPFIGGKYQRRNDQLDN